MFKLALAQGGSVVILIGIFVMRFVLWWVWLLWLVIKHKLAPNHMFTGTMMLTLSAMIFGLCLLMAAAAEETYWYEGFSLASVFYFTLGAIVTLRLPDLRAIEPPGE